MLPYIIGGGILLVLAFLSRRAMAAPTPPQASLPTPPTPVIPDAEALRAQFREEWGGKSDDQIRAMLMGKDADAILAHAISIGLSSSAVYEQIATVHGGGSYDDITYIDSESGAV